MGCLMRYCGKLSGRPEYELFVIGSVYVCVFGKGPVQSGMKAGLDGEMWH